MALDAKHIKKLQGREFVLFSGLIELAHEMGWASTDTELLQIPSDENGFMAIVKATVTMKDGTKHSGHGDATPKNVGPNIVPHLLRMAETRAIARALRLATNVGLTAFEELGADYHDEPQEQRQPRQSRQTTTSAAKVEVPNKAKDSHEVARSALWTHAKEQAKNCGFDDAAAETVLRAILKRDFNLESTKAADEAQMRSVRTKIGAEFANLKKMDPMDATIALQKMKAPAKAVA